jgi:hypothetical protein
MAKPIALNDMLLVEVNQLGNSRGRDVSLSISRLTIHQPRHKRGFLLPWRLLQVVPHQV